MDAINILKELDEMGTMLDNVKSRLARLMPDLVDGIQDDFLISKATMTISSLSRYSRYLRTLHDEIGCEKNKKT